MSTRLGVMLKASLVATAAILAVLVLGSPAEIVVFSDGKILESRNRVRAELHSQRFWEQQAQLARQELARLDGAPKREALERNARQAAEDRARPEGQASLALGRQWIEDSYQAHPELRPTPESKMARERAKARDAAAKIVRMEDERTLEAMTQVCVVGAQGGRALARVRDAVGSGAGARWRRASFGSTAAAVATTIS